MVLACVLCSYRCNLRLDLVKHVFGSHSVEPTFHHVCGIGGCLHSFKFGSTFSSFKSHASRKHPNWQITLESHSNEEEQLQSDTPVTVTAENPTSYPPLDPTLDALDQVQFDSDIEAQSAPPLAQPFVQAERTAGLFLLTFKEKYKLPQTAINFAVGSINAIVNAACESVRASPSSEYQDPFGSLMTEYKQSKFYREVLGLVEPVTVELGSTYYYRRSGAKRSLVEKPETYQYVPLIENLQWAFQNSEVCHEVFKERTNYPGYLVDFCDGKAYKEHPLFGSDSKALQLIVYTDEVEVANPLGSYRGYHKLTVFYYLIGNIEPKLRSSLKCTQLIACCTYPMLQKYGYDMILKPFIEEANRLSEGVTMNIRGKDTFVRGGVLFALADTLAAHNIGGFKVGVGFSLRKCRMCLATREEMSTKFKAKEFVPRTRETYNYHCSLLDGPLFKEDSITYGINFVSPLNDLRDFHVVDHMPQDIMHVLFEGVIPYEVKLMLKCFIHEKKFMTVDLINDRIACHSYSTAEGKDKPSPINAKVFTPSSGSQIAQSSAQMWNLAMNLPVMIGDKIPIDDDNWECFLVLLEIVKLCTAKIACTAHAGILEALIEHHHCLFIECYPSVSVTPKMHYMVHFPRQLIRTGPLVTTWCMRMEAKNSYFKTIAQGSNFKNVTYSVARRHQRLLCAYLNSGNFFDKTLECGPAKEPKTLSTEDPLICDKVKEREVTSEDLQSADEDLVHRPKWISYMGMKYTVNDYLLVGWQEDDLPIFGRIQYIAVVKGKALFCVSPYPARSFDHHYHSYLIHKTHGVHSIYWLDQVLQCEPLQAHCLTNGDLFVTTRSHIENILHQ